MNKLSLQQDKLKNDLKNANEQLLQTTQLMIKEKPLVDPKKETEMLHRQIKNAKEQCEYYEKENLRLSSFTAENFNLQSYLTLESKHKELETEIVTLNRSKRNTQLEVNEIERKIDNSKWADINTKKINSLMDEVSCLKKIIQQNQNTQQQNEKNLKQQEEYIVDMQQKYEDTCIQFHLKPSLNFKQFIAQKDNEELNLKIKDQTQNKSRIQDSLINKSQSHQNSRTDLKNIQSRIKIEIEDNFQSVEKMEVSSQSMVTLQGKLKIWNKNRLTMNKQLSQEENQFQARIKQQEDQKTKSIIYLKEKENQIEILKQKVEELYQNVNFNTLPPISIKKDKDSKLKKLSR